MSRKKTENQTRMRVETDSLGKVDIPIHALYGSQTQRALDNFQISGREAHPALMRAYLRIKLAAATTNLALRVITPLQAKLIRQAVEELLKCDPSEWKKLFPVDPYQAGAGTSQNMNMNEVIANVANRKIGKPLGSYSPVHPNDHVNRSQSTNDTYPTAMRLALLETSARLVDELNALSASLGNKAKDWKHIPKSARTHLQDAVPMMLGQEFSAYSLTLAKLAHWLDQARHPLRILGIGGSAAGTGLTVPKGYSAKIVRDLEALSGEKLKVAPNLCEAMQSQAPVMLYSSTLRIIALELTRICNDLRLLASGPLTGLAEISLPAVQPGSSIMPGKVNPSILEMANQTWFSVLGYDQTTAMAVQAGQLELNVMMPMMAYSLLEATEISANALRTLRTLCIDGLEPNRERLRIYFESTPQIATALSPKLGYQQTANLVKEALKLDIPVVQLIREKQLLTEKELSLLLDAQTLTGMR